jgi:hypothetical protein
VRLDENLHAQFIRTVGGKWKTRMMITWMHYLIRKRCFFFFIYIYKINFINRKKTVQKYERVYLKKYKDKPLIIGPPVSGKEELFMYMVWPS